jgi:hypothetical protein
MRHALWLLVTLPILTLAYRPAVAGDEADAVRSFEKLGGKVVRDDNPPGKPRT